MMDNEVSIKEIDKIIHEKNLKKSYSQNNKILLPKRLCSILNYGTNLSPFKG